MKSRLPMAAAKYGEIAPQAAVCCNACRTCVQSNALALVVAVAAAIVGRFRRTTA
jgi:hypothetical protein